jgi:hypothetical protein
MIKNDPVGNGNSRTKARLPMAKNNQTRKKPKNSQELLPVILPSDGQIDPQTCTICGTTESVRHHLCNECWAKLVARYGRPRFSTKEIERFKKEKK